MKTDNIERYFNSLGKTIVLQTQKELKGKKGSTSLGTSITHKVIKTPDGYSLQFYMDSYGTFLDKGVSGNKKKKKFKNYLGAKITSPYSYTTKQPPPDILSKWIKKKRIKGRDKKSGRFISNLSLAFIIGRAIKRDGIKSLSFFQKPLGKNLKQFAPEMLNAVKEDIINDLTTTSEWQQS